MSSDPFLLLGLDRATATDADVRRAYAERLKTTRPEDDRAGFMALRAAFEQARSELRWREQYGDEVADDGDADQPEASAAGLSSDKEDDEPNPADAVRSEIVEHEDAATRAMNALADVLTREPFGAPVKRVMAILEADDVSGIEDYQSLQWQVRNFLCDRTGYNQDTQALRRPGWLTLELFDALDGYFGWTRQPVTQPWIRQMNDWLARLRQRIVWEDMPETERRKAEIRQTVEALGQTGPDSASGKTGGGLGWLAMAAGILAYALYQFFTRGSGG